MASRVEATDTASVSRIHFRDAMPVDAAAVAALHADSWRRHYRGAYADGYLDSRDELAGFAHVILDADRDWGALLDNLHVAVAQQGRGIGATLMARAGEFVTRLRPESGLYLWVLEQNVAAQRFYEAIGGQPIGIRYVWLEPGCLTSRNHR